MPFAATLITALLTSTAAFSAEASEKTSDSPDRPLVTNRPTDSASPELVPRSTLQIELGYKFTRLDTESGRTDTQELPDLLVRFGISERIEARLTVLSSWRQWSQTAPWCPLRTPISSGAGCLTPDKRGASSELSMMGCL